MTGNSKDTDTTLYELYVYFRSYGKSHGNPYYLASSRYTVVILGSLWSTLLLVVNL